MNSPGRRRAAGRIAAFALVIAAGAGRAVAADGGVDLDTARREVEAGRALLIDVREPVEHAAGVVRGARLMPVREVASRIAEIPRDPTQPVLLICNTQNRSRAIWQALRERGYTNVRFVGGGMSEWTRRGWPVVAAAR